MSECEIVTEDYDSTLRFCLTHDCPVAYDSCGCWRDRAETAEAEVERLTAELADRDRRIEAALNLHYSQCCKLEPPCMDAAILLGQYTLRGES